jgi:hypothetical protein
LSYGYSGATIACLLAGDEAKLRKKNEKIRKFCATLFREVRPSNRIRYLKIIRENRTQKKIHLHLFWLLASWLVLGSWFFCFGFFDFHKIEAPILLLHHQPNQ